MPSDYQGLAFLKGYLEARLSHLEGLMEKGVGSHGYAKQSLGASRDEVQFTLDLVNKQIPKSTRKAGM